ncbi:hypothetical protein [Xanthomonas hyacinthi]|nr:hypothetical protein [Xanthomonas hyacinthi]
MSISYSDCRSEFSEKRSDPLHLTEGMFGKTKALTRRMTERSQNG